MIRAGLVAALLLAAAHTARAVEPAVERCVADYARDAAIPAEEAAALLAAVETARSSDSGDHAKMVAGRRGLAIGALASCHATLGTVGARTAAARMLGALRTDSWDAARGLAHLPGEGAATAIDYAETVHGVLAFYEATGDIAALTFAVDLQDRLDRDAWREAVAEYGTGDGSAAGTALAALNLVRLGRITDDDAFTARSAAIIAAHAPRSAAPMPAIAAAAVERSAPVLHLTLIGGADEAGTAGLLAAAHRRTVPGFAITILDEGDRCRALRARFPGMPLMPRLAGKSPAAYLCTDLACDPPTADPESLARRIAELSTR